MNGSTDSDKKGDFTFGADYTWSLKTYNICSLMQKINACRLKSIIFHYQAKDCVDNYANSWR